MSYLDWTVVGLYFLGLVIIVKWSAKQQKTTADYFLAGRHASWLVVGASLFASNIGSEHIVGLAGNGASSGMAMAHWELQCVDYDSSWLGLRTVLLPQWCLHHARIHGAPL